MNSNTTKTRIVVLKVDHIGDFILALGPLAALRRACPSALLTLVCAHSTSSLARASGLFDEILEFDFFTRDGREPAAFRHVAFSDIRSVVGGSYDLAIDLRHDQDTRPLLECIDAKFKVGFEATNLKNPLDLSLPRLEVWLAYSPQGLKLHAETRMRLLISAAVETFFPTVDDTLQRLVEYGRVSLPFDGQPYFVLAPGSGNRLKNWDVHNYALLGLRLCRNLNMRAVIIGGASEVIEGKIVAACLPEGYSLDLTNRTDAIDLPKLIYKSELFVGNDSGATHLAASLGVPTVCIFSGVADVQIWRPRGRQVAVVIKSPPCAPCNLSDEALCSHGHECTKGITLESVLLATENLLRAPS